MQQSADRQQDLILLSGKIEAAAITLGYPQQTSSEFAGMVIGWKDGSGNSIVAALDKKLALARQDQISKSELAGIEQDIAKQLVADVRRQIRVDDRYFELADVTKYRKAQCLGYTQVFYILAGSINLSVRPINVLELDKKGPLPVGFSHVAAIVELADGRVIMANLVPGGFISGPFTIADTFDRGGNYLKLKDKTNALGIYKRIQILDGEGLAAYIYSNRASVKNSASQFEQATADSSRAIQLYPALAEAWSNRGIARRNAGQIEQAVSDYTKAIGLNPNYAEALNNRGAAYAQSERFEQAIVDYTRAIELNPAFAQAYSNRGNVYASTGQLTQAIADYDRAIERNPNLAQVYGNRAANYALLGKTEQAKKDLAAATRLSPSLASYAKKVSERFNLGFSVDNAVASAAR
jgi:tetratricopeptide (TPR) repeat protein